MLAAMSDLLTETMDGSPAVQVAGGRLRGRTERGVSAFLGVPYAAPPFGARRLRPPERAGRWEGERSATAYGPTCPKAEYAPHEAGLFPEVVTPGAECLNLNVWTPDPGGSGLPVLAGFTVASSRRGPDPLPVIGAPLLPAMGLCAFDLWGRDAVRIQEQLRAAESWEARFAIAEAALARRQDAGWAVDPEVELAWRRMVVSRGWVRVERLAAEVGWSRGRLWSRFRSQAGATPKRAAELVRFDHAAHLLAAGQSAAVVAADSGYADQSHLHREVMAFTGVTPAAVTGYAVSRGRRRGLARLGPSIEAVTRANAKARGAERARGTFVQDTGRCAWDAASQDERQRKPRGG